jgi:phosphonate transport system substrate-binding protein
MNFMVQTYRIAVVVSLCALLVTGCSREGVDVAAPKQQRPTLLIGLVPEQNMFKQIERYDPLARYLSARIGVDIKLTVFPVYDQILSSFTSQKMDAAFFGSLTYVLAHERLGVQVLVRPVSLEGSSSYYGMIFVRKDSGIRSIREMKGKRFVFVDRVTISGYLLPLAFFKKSGVDYREYLKESYYAGTHEDAILDVLDHKADIGAAKSTVFTRLAETDARIRNELRIITRSPAVPENSLAVRRDLDVSLKDKLKTALLTMHEDPEGERILRKFGALRFMVTSDSDYRVVYEYMRAIGLDPHTWMSSR